MSACVYASGACQAASEIVDTGNLINGHFGVAISKKFTAYRFGAAHVGEMPGRSLLNMNLQSTKVTSSRTTGPPE
jgi:hypothetical protein